MELAVPGVSSAVFYDPEADCYKTRETLRAHLLAGAQPLRIAAKVLRAEPYTYEITIDGPEVHVVVLEWKYGTNILAVESWHRVVSAYAIDEATAILAAAEALPSPTTTKET